MIERFLNWGERQQEAGRARTAENLARAEAQRSFYADNGMSPAEMRSALANYAFAAVPWGLAARPLAPAARAVGNFFAPRRVGVHHTVAGTHLGGSVPQELPYWRSRFVRPSGAEYGRQGVTSSDQIPGMTYFWDATGGNARAAATQGVSQPNMIIANNIFGNDTVSRALTVTAPRFGVLADVNPGVQGGVARMVPGANRVRVVGETAGTPGTNVRIPGTRVDVPGGLPPSAVDNVISSINRQRAVEAARSASRVGGAVGAGVAARNFDEAAIREFLR